MSKSKADPTAQQKECQTPGIAAENEMEHSTQQSCYNEAKNKCRTGQRLHLPEAAMLSNNDCNTQVENLNTKLIWL